MESVDKFVGYKIKERRKLLKLSQTKLAELMGLSYQQIQKYENGSNKITLTRLIELSKVLNIPPAYFYEGVELQEDLGKPIHSDIISNERTKALNVLIVEDNADDEILLREAIESGDEMVSVNIVRDADMVIDYLRNHADKFAQPRPDIVFMDLTFPKVDGVSILKAIKKDRELLEIPIIIITNSISVAEMTEIYRLQAAGFISKTFDFEEFADNIRTAIKYWSQVVVLPNMQKA